MTRIIENMINKRMFILVYLLMAIPYIVNADIKEKERTRLRINYVKLENGNKQLSAILTAGRGKNMTGISEADITFKASADDSTQVLAKVKTNANGEAMLYVEEGYKFPVDEEGYTEIAASFRGNDTLRASSGDMMIRDIFIDLAYDMIDSIKTLHVKAFVKDMDGNEMAPGDEVDILIGIQRLYSVLPLDEVTTDEDGLAELEFPDDIPGDSLGIITIVAKIDESDDYATVFKRGEINWGTPVDYTVHKLPRQLFTDEAPLWMIMAVFVVLAGAWYHFFLSLYKVSKIPKSADEK
jgi:hypothetical protein